MTTTIIITGASSGLGAEMARQFAAKGYDLGLSARRVDRLEELRAEILARHPERSIELRALDVTDADAVRTVFQDLKVAFGRIDRVIVNAGLGKGGGIGKGRAAANLETATTNFLGALHQCEAAMEIFREQRSGHLVMISSLSAMRGMPGSMTVYAATKAGVAKLAEGVQMEMLGKPIDVSVIYPGYIRSEMNDRVEQKTRFMVDTETGVRTMVAAIEARRSHARVPRWPWGPLGWLMKVLPLRQVRKLV